MPSTPDKLVALDRDKAEFCYLICRARGSPGHRRAGTSFGVSTLYLAAALRDNGGGVVIATEYEPEKARRARQLPGRGPLPGLSTFARAPA